MRFFLVFVLSFFLTFGEDFADEYEVKEHKADLLKGYNKAMTSVNDFLYTNLFIPTAKGYAYIAPQPGRQAISNFFENLQFPMRFLNNLLQFKFKAAFDESRRFVANTIIGFGGISDVASNYYKIPKHDEDFGQTLGKWGVGSGPHIVLPIFGPSNLRDSFGLVADIFSNPITYIKPDETAIAIGTYRRFNDLSLHHNQYEALKKSSISLYEALKESYEQNREHKIKD